MARLPAVFDAPAPQSVRPSAEVVDASSLGNALSNIGGAVSRHDDEMDREAAKEAQGHVQQLMAAYAPARAQREADYQEGDTTFAASEIGHYDALAKDYRDAPDLSPRVRRQLNIQLDAMRAKVSDSAIAFDAVKAGQLESQRRAALDMSADAKASADLMTAAQGAQADVANAWDGRSAGYATGVRDAIEKALKPIMDSLPEDQRLRLTSSVTGMANTAFAQALAKERKGQDAYVIGTANDTADLATNMVTQDPETFQAAGFLIDKAAAALPASLQDAYRKDGQARLFMSRMAGLISQGKLDQVKAELPDWKTTLSPDDYARVTASVGSAEKRAAASDYTAQAAMSSRMNAYLDGIVSGVQADRPADADIAAVAGEKGLAQFRMAETFRKDAVARMGDFGSLNVAEMDQRIVDQAARVKQGGADYDQNLKLVAAMQAARDAQVKARQTDPAAWAMTGDGQASDPAKPVAAAWQQAQAAPDAQARQFALNTYAQATLARQQQAGVAMPKLLPGGVARSLVAAVKDAPDDKARADALIGLMSGLSDWGANRGQVLSELRAAGLSSENALVASELSADPLSVRAYMAGGTEMKAWKPKQRDNLTDAVMSGLGKMDATLVGPAASAQTRADRYGAMTRIAAGYMAQGESQSHAVQHALRDYTDHYVFASTYRIPTDIGKAIYDNVPDPRRGLGLRKQTGAMAVDYGVYYVMQSLDRPGQRGAPLSDNEATARNMYNNIKANGRWVTRDDDGGLQLMVPNTAAGTWQVVTDKAGKPYSYSWEDLIGLARKGGIDG